MENSFRNLGGNRIYKENCIRFKENKMIPNYEPSNPIIESRDEIITNPIFTKPVVPKIPSSEKKVKFSEPVPQEYVEIMQPVMDRVPQDYVEQTDGLDSEQRKIIFLDNSQKRGGFSEKHENTHLGNSPEAYLFFGTLSVLGLFIVYRTMQNYT